MDAHGRDLETALGVEEMREQSDDLDVGNGAGRGDEWRPDALTYGEHGGFELGGRGALVEDLGEWHTWIKIRG